MLLDPLRSPAVYCSRLQLLQSLVTPFSFLITCYSYDYANILSFIDVQALNLNMNQAPNSEEKQVCFAQHWILEQHPSNSLSDHIHISLLRCPVLCTLTTEFPMWQKWLHFKWNVLVIKHFRMCSGSWKVLSQGQFSSPSYLSSLLVIKIS